MARSVLLVIAVVVVAVVVVLGMRGADAARPARESPGGSWPACWNTYEEARANVAAWMARLGHGPSDGGAGH
ncbi:hypothetical protein MUK42_09587 [Musa troglodytarum]|uniref:Uncharacterized protein n=1 Tax=Musa troglodytarum TaxID=320322 RepID=A0A9E7EDV0_9LILI|nr:hypothetical protein MUK42_09587 [Musa troglodytarum]